MDDVDEEVLMKCNDEITNFTAFIKKTQSLMEVRIRVTNQPGYEKQSENDDTSQRLRKCQLRSILHNAWQI